LVTGLDRPTGYEAAMTFQEWRKEGEQMLMAWHHDDPACVDNDHWRQCFEVAPSPKGARHDTPA